jgi:Na+/H+ antiporter NhaD/arsenite permease-like protein
MFLDEPVLTALMILLATVSFVIWQPRGLGIGWSAAAWGYYFRLGIALTLPVLLLTLAVRLA